MVNNRFKNFSSNRINTFEISGKPQLGRAFQTKNNVINQHCSNSNLFHHEAFYIMNKNNHFENKIEENNCQTDKIFRFFSPSIIFISFIIFNSLINLFNYHGKYFLFSISRIVILCIALFLIIKKKDIISEVNPRLRVMIAFEIFLDIMEDNEQLSFRVFSYYLMKSSAFNFFFSVQMDIALFYSGLIFLQLLMSFDYPESYFITRLFYNIFSRKCLWGIAVYISSNMIMFYGDKGFREIWALYDSFKRSYNNLKIILDEFPLPIFIVSKNNFNIFYKNQCSDIFLKNMIAHKSPIKKQTMTLTFSMNNPSKMKKINFSDLFFDSQTTKKFEKLFHAEVQKCLDKNEKFFDFPFTSNSDDMDIRFIENPHHKTLFICDYSHFQWYRIVVSPYIWNNQEAVMLKFINIQDIITNEFTHEYNTLINNEYRNILENMDSICATAPDLEEEKIKNPLSLVRFNEEIPEENIVATKEVKRPKLSMLKKEKSSIDLKTGSQQFNFKINVEKAQTQELQKNDYLFFYFLKFNSNNLYDNYLTTNIYHSMKLNKSHKNFAYFNLKNLFQYLISNFYVSAKLRDFIIDLNWNISNFEETFGIYEYYRVIIYNVLNFIINNTLSDNRNKKINISVEFVRFQQQDYLFKVEFEIYDDNENYISYEDMKRILETTNIFNLNSKEIDKFKLFDIGIFVAYNLLQRVYGGDFNISNHQFGTKLSFIMKGEAILSGGNTTQPPSSTIYRSKNTFSKIVIELPRTKVEQQYFKTLIDKTSLMRTARYNTKLETKYIDDGKFEKFDLESDIYSLKDDKALVNCLHLSLSKISSETIETPIKKRIKSLAKTRLGHSDSHEIKERKTNYRIGWDNTYIMENVKFCNPPRFLIVDDNVNSRKSMKHLLKKLNNDYRFDNAANGKEAIQKFKNLFNKGYLFDFILMDIELPEIRGVEATQIIRQYESEYKGIHSNIIAVSVNDTKDGESCFDTSFEKPVNREKFFHYISENMKNRKTDTL